MGWSLPDHPSQTPQWRMAALKGPPAGCAPKGAHGRAGRRALDARMRVAPFNLGPPNPERKPQPVLEGLSGVTSASSVGAMARIEIPVPDTEPLVRVPVYMYPKERQALREQAACRG